MYFLVLWMTLRLAVVGQVGQPTTTSGVAIPGRSLMSMNALLTIVPQHRATVFLVCWSVSAVEVTYTSQDCISIKDRLPQILGGNLPLMSI